MTEIIEKLVNSLKEGNILLASVIVTITLIFHYKKVIEFFEYRKKARIAKISEALSCELINGLTKSHLEEQLANEYFRIATGMALEKNVREAIIAAHKRTSGELNFIHFKRALPYLTYTNQTLSVQISKFNEAEYLFNKFAGIYLVFSGLFLMLSSIIAKGDNFYQQPVVFGLGGVFFIISFFVFALNFPLFSARKVSEALNNFQ